ncbi:hypothetical protein [Costertonia aggregata]|uniref:Fibronectin type III domain-containing protein n=1 Tax=Costertonia aggregata TaxID=343403 RepID=A0A7H9AUA9_9FLAO|nr:hypothetical protein [Costertonia aggregata]QLG46785.1 hypothetical protein HYG79_15980 [Costertonia aggregata]
MRLRSIGLYFLLAVMLLACEDILEEPDISEKQVQMLAPTDGATITGNRVSFNWNSIPDATSYNIQVARPNFENAVQILLDSTVVQDTTGFVMTRIRDLGLLNGDYTWRIKALNGGFETGYTVAAFTVNGDENADLVPPNIPSLIAPSDESVTDNTNITFTWSRTDVSGSPELDSIYIFTDQNLQTLEIKGMGANKSFTADLGSNTYYWFVKAFDAAGNESNPSETFDFTIN